MPAFLPKLFIPFSFSLMLLFHQGQLAAQCSLTGQVINLSYAGNCGLVILEYQNYTLLVPSDTLSGLAEGMEISFSYEPSNQTCPCTAGTHIDIICLEVISAPAVACEAGFNYAATPGTDFKLLFQPFSLDNTLSYFWEFGDGGTSTLPSPYHTFQQGLYEVCLTTEGTSCAQATTCQTIDLQSCTASFGHTTPVDGTVVFENTSTGDFTHWQWEPGDGAIFYDEVLGTYDYGAADIYTACLTVWSNDGCFSKYCNHVFSGTGDVCEFTDCVLPGDTDGDGNACVYDLLPLGVGYGAEGPGRQEDLSTNINWSPQFATDWGIATVNGIDYKHLDCNGDGQINELDADIIQLNYQEPGNPVLVETPGAPYFWLDFDWDTVVINDNSPPFIELEADLVAGQPQVSFENLKGFALQFDYPAEMVADDGVEADYNDNSFFGSSNNIMWFGKNRFQAGRYDLGLTRKMGSSGGFGDVAKLKFIVIADVIGRTESAIPFTVSIEGAIALNPEGELMALGASSGSATVVILNKMTTGTSEKWLEDKVAVFPNPASANLYVNLQDVQGQLLQVFNPMGQIVHEQRIQAAHSTVGTSHWGKGVFCIKIQTDAGLVNKKVVIE
ncbi:MAG: T9SS type A sorting domain-containing protein [Lewinellaceae bacterium]|nr:T9SS type A sorting domain-containing protein [Saprospiraceae bacterium]MCB9339048.1 T9SS type A sorting domain-containing protein [Lewinellaceae bacterium]